MTTAHQRLAATPFLDAWREELRTALNGRGLKTELARSMAAARHQSLAEWQNRLSRILRGDTRPHAEDVLAISHWLASRTDTPKKSAS